MERVIRSRQTQKGDQKFENIQDLLIAWVKVNEFLVVKNAFKTIAKTKCNSSINSGVSSDKSNISID